MKKNITFNCASDFAARSVIASLSRNCCISLCKNLLSSSHCLTGMTLSLASFHSLATTVATLFAVTFARANSLSRVFRSSYLRKTTQYIPQIQYKTKQVVQYLLCPAFFR